MDTVIKTETRTIPLAVAAGAALPLRAADAKRHHGTV